MHHQCVWHTSLPKRASSQKPARVGIKEVSFRSRSSHLSAFYSSAAVWNAHLARDSSLFLKSDRWTIIINAMPLFMSIQT
jgi:hypothetical protein